MQTYDIDRALGCTGLPDNVKNRRELIEKKGDKLELATYDETKRLNLMYGTTFLAMFLQSFMKIMCDLKIQGYSKKA